jgi:plastocyanin
MMKIGAAIALALAAPRRSVCVAGIVLSLATVAVWAVSRTAGVPVGPQPWVPEPVGRADAVATLLELTTATVLAPLVRPAPGRAGTGMAVALLTVAVTAATAFAVAPGGGQHAGDAGAHDHESVVPLNVPGPGPTGEFSLADARRARGCATRIAGAGGEQAAAAPRTRVTITARRLCFDATVLTLAAGRPVVVRLDNRERSRSPLRAHTFSIYAFSTIPAKHHPVVIGDPVRPGASLDVRFRAPPPGAYFFQCDIHRFMRGIVVFR